MAAGPPDEAVAGRIVDARGDPVADALVTIPAGSAPLPEIALLVDAGGRFGLRLPPGRFTLRAHAAGASGETEIAVPRQRHVVITVGPGA